MFFSLLLSFSLHHLILPLLSSTLRTNKAKQKKCSALLYYLLSFRPDPSSMLISHTISISRTRISTKSQPMRSHPKKATKNKIRIIPEQCYISSLDNIYNVPCYAQTLLLLFSVQQKTTQCFWHSVWLFRCAQKQSYIEIVCRSVAAHKRGVRLKKTCLSSRKYLSLLYYQLLFAVSWKNFKVASLVSVSLFDLNAFSTAFNATDWYLYASHVRLS